MTARDKPSEEFLRSEIGELIADYGENCEEASLASDNAPARDRYTDLADECLAQVERLLATELRKARIEGMEAAATATYPIDVDAHHAIANLIAEERAKP